MFKHDWAFVWTKIIHQHAQIPVTFSFWSNHPGWLGVKTTSYYYYYYPMYLNIVFSGFRSECHLMPHQAFSSRTCHQKHCISTTALYVLLCTQVPMTNFRWRRRTECFHWFNWGRWCRRTPPLFSSTWVLVHRYACAWQTFSFTLLQVCVCLANL